MEQKSITSIRMFVDEGQMKYLHDFKTRFSGDGNVISFEGKNDVGQVYIRVRFTTPEAIVWMYRWIHMFMLDGNVNQSRDYEIRWMTGSDEFINVVYAILYKKRFDGGTETLSNVNAKA